MRKSLASLLCTAVFITSLLTGLAWPETARAESLEINEGDDVIDNDNASRVRLSGHWDTKTPDSSPPFWLYG
ncbi:MAG: hypothetical protein K0R57_444 [Paenibacillaceae bacterium]|jgi:hypothetical protein|nr:hypothetical protein [Paenibacillaceae bacterium]